MMVGAPGRVALVVCLACAMGARSPAVCAQGAAPAPPDRRAEARAHYEKGTGAYALGRYADAAAEFEQAFALKPDPAILYNAAQANRLASKRDRAIELYRNYLRVYGRRAEHAADVEWHIGELSKAAETERLARGREAPAVAPASPLVAPPLEREPAPSLVSQPRPVPVYRRWWLWAGTGALVAGVVVGAILLSRRSPDCGAGVDYCAKTGL